MEYTNLKLATYMTATIKSVINNIVEQHVAIAQSFGYNSNQFREYTFTIATIFSNDDYRELIHNYVLPVLANKGLLIK